MEVEILGYKMLIDDEDAHKIGNYKWHIKKPDIPFGLFYFYRSAYGEDKKRIAIYLHRDIMGCTTNDGLTVDHINRNTLDNRKENLRVTTQKENTYNRKCRSNNKSGYKGVYSRGGRYYACIQSFHIGVSSDPIECAKMYDMVAIRFYKEFAYTNFPRESYLEEDIEVNYQKFLKISKLTSRNKSGYRGVCYIKEYTMNPWWATLCCNRVRYNLGRFNTPEEAARAYDKKARELLGDKAKLNFPEEAK